MDTYKLFIKTKIHSLTYQKKLLFCLILSERLVENYDFFSKKYRYGDVQLLNKVLSNLFAEITSNHIKNINHIEKLIEFIEEVTPYTEDFPTIYVSFALDACTSIISTLYFVIDKNDEYVADVASYSRDTVDMFIQERDNLDINSSNIERYIEQDKFMKNEIKYQNDLIDYLIGIDKITNEEIVILRNRSINPINLKLLE